MTSLSDFPPDVQAAAQRLFNEIDPEGAMPIDPRPAICRAIVQDRAGRHLAAGLTSKQHELLNMMAAYQAQHGTTPSFEEMRLAMGLTSKSGIHRLISGLEERGAIQRLPNRSRAITIIANPN